MTHDDYLMHYGVKGMKWGVRRTPQQLGRRMSSAKEMAKTSSSIVRNYTGSKRSDAVTNARHKDINKMSNQELQAAITRMNLEQQYRSLTRVDFMRGQKTASNILKSEKTYKQVKNLIKK